MATEAQVRANRANAQRSTGPRTEEGKAASAVNALRHGFRAAHLLLPEEDGEPLVALHDELLADLNPRGPMEQTLFDRVVAAAWRLRRAHLVERGILERVNDGYDPADNAPTFTQLLRRKFQSACMSADALGKLSRYESAIERSMYRSLTELRRLQGSRRNGAGATDAGAAQKKLPNEPNSVVSRAGVEGNAAEGA